VRVNEILEGRLWQRGQFLTASRSSKRATLDNLGIDVIVNLWTKPDPDLDARPNERLYVHWPIHGTKVEDKFLLRLMVKFIVRLIEHDHKVLIHCEAGVNRSIFLVTLVVAALEKISTENALELVRGRCGRIKMQAALEALLPQFGESE